MAEAIVARLRSRYTPHTAYIRRGVLQRLWTLLAGHGAPLLKLPKIRKPDPRGVTAAPEQIAALERSASPGMRLFILLCWQTALRFSEALAVSPRSYDAEQHTIRVRVKGGKDRIIPVTPEIEDLLRVASREAADTGESCVVILHGKPISRKGIRSAWQALCKRAGVTGIRPHDLRRTTATNLYALSKDLRAVQQYLGHSSMTSTLHYLAPLSEEALRGMHQLLNFHAKGPVQ